MIGTTETTRAPDPSAEPGLPPPATRRWRRRRILSGAVRAATFAIPFVAASLAVAVAQRAYGPSTDPLSSVAGIMRLLSLLAVAVLTAVVAERATHRLAPLASLLQLSLLFPDRAPSRLLVALRAGAARDARELLEDTATPVDQRAAAQRILVLVAALGRHDRITRGHCERVRAYADLMASRLDLPPDEVDRLRWAALLHDVGKLRVSYAILNKRSRLDADEWEAIRRHPTDGADLVAPMAGWLGSWTQAVAQHHERVDGTGYPAGLGGDDIHVGARIIAVVDAFDVMTASRSYKRPISSAAARRELQRCAGTQFDPEMVSAFLAASSPRVGWLAGVAAALVQTRLFGIVSQVPARAAALASTVPAAAATTVSTVTVGLASVTLVAGLSTVAPAAPGAAASAPDRTSTAPSGSAPAGAPAGTEADGGTTPGSSPGTTSVAPERQQPDQPPAGPDAAPSTVPGVPDPAGGSRQPDPATASTTTTTSPADDSGDDDGDDDGSSGKGGGSGGTGSDDRGRGGGGGSSGPD